jgi:DNA-binding transcriptional LysR family regulator
MSMLRNQDLNLLPIFDALVRERQLSRAAEALSMSQPAVSNALKRLRLSFKDDLFVRTRQGLVPTERALELHALIGPALNLVQRSFESELFDPLTSDRVINISMNTTMETLFLADFIKPLRQAAPQLRFRFFPDYLPEIPARLKDGRLNYAVEYIPLPEDKFDSVVLS